MSVSLPIVPDDLQAAGAAGMLTIRPWPDPVIDSLGYDPRSAYVERFWLGILGPSTIFLLRRIAAELETQPAGFELPLQETARALGLGLRGGRNAPFVRTLQRCCQFGMARMHGDGAMLVRRKLPPLARNQVSRLPEELQAAHASWQLHQLETPGVEQLRTRARRLALSLLELGEGVEATERQLHRWKFHPALSREATAWAWDRHRQARDAARDQGGDAA